MRRTTLVAGAAATVICVGALAVPAMAGTTTPTSSGTSTSGQTSSGAAGGSTSPGLTDQQQQELDDFLAAHPRVAERLVARIEQWKAFADAHPELVAELKKVAALPQDQRRAELRTWLTAHPDDAKALHEFRRQIRQERKDRREQRRAQHQA